MTRGQSSKMEIIKTLQIAKDFLGRAIDKFEQGEDCLEVMRLTKKSREYLVKADELIIDRHLRECLQRFEPKLLTDEVVKTFKYSRV